jgi:hypothetical protein
MVMRYQSRPATAPVPGSVTISSHTSKLPLRSTRLLCTAPAAGRERLIKSWIDTLCSCGSISTRPCGSMASPGPSVMRSPPARVRSKPCTTPAPLARLDSSTRLQVGLLGLQVLRAQTCRQ